MATIEVFCATCQKETTHTHALDAHGEHLLQCTEPAQLVRACTACVGQVEHRGDDAGEVTHGNEEYRQAEVRPEHVVGEPYAGLCQAFLKLPADMDMDAVTAYLEAYRDANDRRALPEPPCVHYFSTVAPRVGDSVCDRCHRSHREIFAG